MYQFKYEVLGKDTSLARVYRVHYDSIGRVNAWEYISARRSTRDPEWNIAGVKVSFAGEEEHHRFLDEFGQPTPLQGSRTFAERRIWMNERTKSKLIELERDGLPVAADPNGCSAYLYEHDRRGRIVLERCLDESDQEIAFITGSYGMRMEYDESARTVTEIDLDEFGHTRRDWSPVRKRMLDSLGNELFEVKFDMNRKLLPAVLPSRRLSYDGNGYVARMEEITGESVIYRTEYKFDERGNELEKAEYPSSKAKYKTGLARTLSEYDGRNLKRSESFFDREGQLIWKARYQYDSMGYLLRVDLLDPQEEPLTDYTFSHVKYTRDRFEKTLRMDYLDSEDKPFPTKDGYAAIVNAYDSDGQIVEMEYRDADDKPTSANGLRIASTRYTYSAKGRLLTIKKFGADGKELSIEDSTQSR